MPAIGIPSELYPSFEDLVFCLADHYSDLAILLEVEAGISCFTLTGTKARVAVKHLQYLYPMLHWHQVGEGVCLREDCTMDYRDAFQWRATYTIRFSVIHPSFYEQHAIAFREWKAHQKG